MGLPLGVCAGDTAATQARNNPQQLHFFPQLQALLSFIGQFLPVFLQL
jgi:hypothetical protein